MASSSEKTSAHSRSYSERALLFSGKKSAWPFWEEKFLAKAGQCGYVAALTRTKDVAKSTATLNENTDDGKAALKLQKLNRQAYQDLILCMDETTGAGQTAFLLVRSTKTTDYADGNAKKAWTKLKNKYAPTTAPTLSQVQEEFFSAKMKKHGNPDVFITKLEDLR